MKTPAGKLFRQKNIELFSESDDSDFENDEVENESENDEAKNEELKFKLKFRK